MNENDMADQSGLPVRSDEQRFQRSGCRRIAGCFIQQRIGEYKSGGVASTLMARNCKSASDLIVGVNNEPVARDKVLQILRETYGTQAVQQWGIGMLELVQQAGLLQYGVHEASVSAETENGDELGCYAQICASDKGRELLRNLWRNQENGCTSYRQEPAEQRSNEPDKTVQELSHETAHDAQNLLDMWEKGEGIGLLQQALHSFQEIWRSDDNSFSETSGRAKQRKYIVRRLSPIECARLQGFPDWWCDGADGSDSAQYKLWGNGIALPCAADVIGRISRAVERGW